MPSLQHKHEEESKPSSSPVVESVIGLESSSSMDMCSFKLCLAAQLVKILLTSSPELDSDGKFARKCVVIVCWVLSISNHRLYL